VKVQNVSTLHVVLMDHVNEGAHLLERQGCCDGPLGDGVRAQVDGLGLEAAEKGRDHI
jgi:hypothetical protein